MMRSSVYSMTMRHRGIGVLVGVAAVLATAILGIWVYADIQGTLVSFISQLPSAYLSILGISAEGGFSSIVLGEMMNLVAPLVLSGLAISIGNGVIAGEERAGTLGLLLANPLGRARVVVEKLAATVTLLVGGGILLWAGVELGLRAFDADADGLSVAGSSLHVVSLAIFFGMLAAFVGAWTGDPTRTTATSVGVLVVSFLGAGLFPLVEGGADAARVFPWHYLNGSQPLMNGVDWSHIAILAGSSALLGLGAVQGFRRRDLRLGEGRGALVDRLEGHRLIGRLYERLAGRTRVAGIWVKAVSESRGITAVAAGAVFAMAVIVGPFYNGLSDTLVQLGENLPEIVLAAVGFADLSAPAGWYWVEIFSIVVPAAVVVVAVVAGTRGVAGEEEQHTLDLLLANPIPRARIVLEQSLAMVVMSVSVGAAAFGGTLLGSSIAGLDLDPGGIASASILASALGIVFGGLALALGAASGSPRIAGYSAAGVAVAAYVVYTFFPVSERLSEWVWISPFHHYASGDPLQEGMAWNDLGILLAGGAISVLAAVVAFDRRDVRS